MNEAKLSNYIGETEEMISPDCLNEEQFDEIFLAILDSVDEDKLSPEERDIFIYLIEGINSEDSEEETGELNELFQRISRKAHRLAKLEYKKKKRMMGSQMKRQRMIYQRSAAGKLARMRSKRRAKMGKTLHKKYV